MKAHLRHLVFTAFLSLVGIADVLAQSEIKVGWIGPLSGNSAALGVDSVEVAKQVFEKANDAGGINGAKIRLLVEDDQYQTAKTVSSYNRLAHAENVKVIFVLTYGGMLAISPLAQREGIILIDPLDCDEELAALPENIFCVAKKTEDLGINNALHSIKRNNLPAAIIYFEGDPFPVKVAAATKDTLEKQGAKVVLFEGADGSTRDFRSLLLRVKRNNSKSLFVYGYDDFGLVLSQARQLGITATIYSVPGAGIGTEGFNKTAGAAVNGVYAGGWFAPRTDSYATFRADYKSKMGREPILEVSTIPTFDMANVLVSAFAKVYDEKSASLNIDKLKAYLYAIKGYNGLSGNITIDSDGAVRTLKVGMYLYENGNFKNAE